MCQVRLISVPDHTFQFQHVHKLGIKQYCDVLSMLNKRFWPYLPISRCLQARDKKILRCARRLISVPDHFFQFQRVQIREKSIEIYQGRLILVSDHNYPFQHVYWFGITKYWDMPGTINKRSWSYIPISTCPQARNKTVLRCAEYA